MINLCKFLKKLKKNTKIFNTNIVFHRTDTRTTQNYSSEPHKT